MEIDIKLYSTTIVNNNSAKQAVDKKKKPKKLVKMWPIINKDKRQGTTHSNTKRKCYVDVYLNTCVIITNWKINFLPVEDKLVVKVYKHKS